MVLRAVRHDLQAMLEYLLLLFSLNRATVRDHQALIADNLLLRHQLAVLTRPTQETTSAAHPRQVLLACGPRCLP